MIVETLAVGRLSTNCYLLIDDHRGRALVVDPGGDGERIEAAIARHAVHVEMIVLTHSHFDHVLAADALRAATGAPLAIHEAEAAMLADPPALFRYFSPDLLVGLHADRLLRSGEVLQVGDLRVEVLPTPGHSPGGISLYVPEEGIVIAGDALFREGVGRTDFPGSDPEALARGIREHLYALPDETVVYPGHGPETTIGYEKRHNPFVRGAS